MYNLIALDIDGTLLNSEKKITKEVFDSIQKAKLAGKKVVLSTGRPLPGVTPLLKELNLCDDGDFVICFNGAIVQEVKTNRVISNIEMCFDDFKLIHEFSKKHNTNIHINTPTSLVIPVDKPSKYTVRESQMCNLDIISMKEEDINDDITFCKIMVVDEPEILDEIIKEIPQSLKDKYTVVKSAPFFLEFLNKKAHKGNALLALCDSINLPIEETIAVGDEENDQHMIQVAGLGVAMGNARQSIKDIANHITDTNNNHGVSKVIEEFLLNV